MNENEPCYGLTPFNGLLEYGKFKRHPERAQAFLGWATEVAGPVFPYEAADNEMTVNLFFELWMTERFSLQDCVLGCCRLGRVPERVREVMDISLYFPLGAVRGDHKPDELGPIEQRVGNAQYLGYPYITRWPVPR